MKSRSAMCLVLSSVLALGVCSASAADRAAEFTFVRGQWPLFVPVRFGSQTCDFILDTGCTRTIVDSSLQAQLGEPKGKYRGSTPLGKAVSMQTFAAPLACIGPFSLADCNEVQCTDLNKPLAESLGRQVHGVLGMDFLKKHMIRVDFDEGRIAFLDNRQEGRRDWGEEFPITYRNGVPQMRLSLYGRAEQDFGIDTGGGTSGTLAADSFRLAAKQGRLKPVDTSVITGAGVVKSRQVRTGRLTAGPFLYEGLIFTEARINILGLGFLSRHVATFDFPHGRLYLKKGKSFDKRDEAGMCGLNLEWSDGRPVVSGVQKKGPAAKAGIRAGDVILTLDGRDAGTYDRWDVRDLLRSGQGRQIAMTIQRAGKTRNVVVTLERQL